MSKTKKVIFSFKFYAMFDTSVSVVGGNTYFMPTSNAIPGMNQLSRLANHICDSYQVPVLQVIVSLWFHVNSISFDASP
jgi:hypothetical protein